MHRLVLLLPLLFGCPATEKPPADTDDGEPVACDPADPVAVRLTNDRGWYISDATVTWSNGAETGDCANADWDLWNCDAPAEGDLTITATHPLHVGATEVLAATDGCRAGGDEVVLALAAAGDHFDTSRMYYQQLFEDPYECEHSWEIYGMGCYHTAAFCADGYTAIMVTDILNSGVYDLGDGVISNTTMGVADIPEESTFTVVSDTELTDWSGETWRLDEAGQFELYDCGE